MKKLLVGSAAIALGLAVAAPAHAQLQLGVAGHFKGYVDWENQSTTGVARERHIDIIRDTEVHFTGETTLDNGLTVGVHVEAQADAGDGFAVDESYAYASGYWGRVNFGDEDGAAFLLQVAAPSADSNVDGIRQYVNPVNYGLTGLAGVGPQLHGPGGNVGSLDYANDFTRHFDKITYLTPVFSGFQAGVSYTPDASGSALASSTFGNQGKDDGGIFGSVYEAAARWEGTYNNVGLNLGGGYTWAVGEGIPSAKSNDDLKQWNVGADANIAAFGIGAIYTHTSNTSVSSAQRTYDLGADWTTGPFKLGASWLNNKSDDLAGAGNDVKTNRYSGGAVYTFAPGMSFRGSVGLVRSKVDGPIGDVDATYGLLGTQINF